MSLHRALFLACVVLLSSCDRAKGAEAKAAPELRASASAARPKRDPSQPPDDCPDRMAGIPGGKLVVEKYEDLNDADRGPPTRKDFKIAPFCLDKTEVTVADMEACVAAKACTEPTAYVFVDPSTIHPAIDDFREKLELNWKSPEMAKRKNHPINGVSFEQAKAFCKFQDKRLPSEWEVQWAMQGGSKATKYPWGDEEPSADRANLADASWKKQCKAHSICLVSYVPDDYWSDGFAYTAPVGSFPKGANPWGVLDLVGNVEEWTASIYGKPPGGVIVSTRGGAFDTEPDPHTLHYDVEASYGRGVNPRPFKGGIPDPYTNVGVRCARDVDR